MINNINIIPPNLGKLITIKPANPAAGNNFSVAVPIHTIALVTSISFVLTTDATVANRTVLLMSNDGVDNLFITPAPVTQVASQAFTYIAQAGNAATQAPTAYGYKVFSLSQLNYLRFGDSFNSIIDGMQAADTITSIKIRYMQWIQE